MSSTDDWVNALQARAERALEKTLPPANNPPKRLHEAMRYAVLGGGKRLRPLLTYSAGIALGVSEAVLDAPASAVELIHAYSLVHDDLPSMDNDSLRRGHPTCHKAFGETTALLAGDALQALAFRTLAEPTSAIPAKNQINMLELLAEAAGSRGMAGGQAIDLDSVGVQLTLSEMETMHRLKTGALIRASVLLGAWCHPEITQDTLENLDRFAQCIGLAFQIQDDVLDVESDTATLGKPQGSDKAQDKPTYPSLLGLTQAKARAQSLLEDARQTLRAIDAPTEHLEWLADFIVKRRH
ncbi:(2E,6E)-farnesyl diphosphate synthase [Nitrosococcus oceani]|uniref:Farnesyl-diphosphate synthase n=2 Tax=Nitrosococcus oceani TaxID=1229 RepID=Q3J9J9_NITOC|nr:farnesyl diphosphate synthase [Nitrosococcus oceani]KFI19101.1 geranyl transferase [Nitrosococcus oceani C-27]ABA58497.1 farnesyl-diphosphate synthase [Nitrosococcus oceani ATCC 19707]EDZ68498.1 polyprenyl synthetase superfamily [Nitrosococcus oceani AFC27]KFI22318.1 geranyl transferase [Nitrosococcus oceani]GEM18895.1 (2E,6E)-farnesyl diphosphate synthase [Nitrosococcus oceani]